jgi:hypothetical protein
MASARDGTMTQPGDTSGKRIRSLEALRALHDAPSDIVRRKTIDRLDAHCRSFIARSPFLLLGTARRDGRADVSPRGDPPGFVKVLDDTTLLIPDRPGNNLLDSLANIVENPEVGLLFLVPGFDETLRVNGAAEISIDPQDLARLEVEGKRPKLALRVAVREAFLHCAKSFRRARLWDPAARVERGALPSLGRMVMEMARMNYEPALDARVEKAMEKLY